MTCATSLVGLLSALFMLKYVSAIQGRSREFNAIPPRILAQLRNVTSHAELFSQFRVVKATQRSDVETGALQERDQNTLGGLQGVGSSFGSGNVHSIQVAVSAGNTQASPLNTDEEIITNPTMSQGSCKPFKHCVPLPIERIPNLFYMPNCIDIEQCAGGCCDFKDSCRVLAKKTVHVRLSAYEFRPEVEQFVEIESNYVPMERHLECGCDKLPQGGCDEEITCSYGRVLLNCECVCENHEEAANCVGFNRSWDVDTCRCACSDVTCPYGEIQDRQSCKCVQA